MKKIILLSVSMLAGIFILVSFSSKKNAIPAIVTKPAGAGIINCPPPMVAPALMTAAAFKAKYEPNNVIRVRKNVDALSTAEINAFKVGVLKMRALPYTNPTSWLYQAAIHGTTLPDNMTSWNSCHRAGEEFFFLAWHRMYVYFFERIIRAKSGRANLTIPYWNYQIDPVLHPAFRDNSPGNPLYQLRNATINSGGALPSSIMTSFSTALNNLTFYGYQSGQNGPHGSVHTTVNGEMANVSTAAKDPVFWLHHGNIDRLWEEWLSRCNGRANPPATDTAWMNKTYTFFDENGSPVSMQGSQVVAIATQLSYRYDDLTPELICPAARTSFVSRESLLKKESPVQINGQTQKVGFAQESPDELQSFIATKNRRNFNFAGRPTSEKLMIIFEGVKIELMPEGVVEVYLNLPAGVTPAPGSNNFVGLLDLFSAQHSSHHGAGQQEGENLELDATKVAQALGLTIADMQRANVSFFVRGATLNGVEDRTEAQVEIRRIRFSVDSYRQN